MTRATVDRLLVREREAARLCSLSRAAFRRECPVAPVRIGDELRYPVAKLQSWVDALDNVDAPSSQPDWLARLGGADGHHAR
jgi:hypothetical protein